MAYAPPVFEARPTFKTIGADVTSVETNQMSANIDRMNDDEKARAFQQHLQTGLTGMQQVMKELPPEVLASVPDPSAYADSDEKRVMWYQSVNQAVNRGNMQKAAAAGDVAGVERMSLFDSKAKPEDFQNVADNRAIRGAVKGMDFNVGGSPKPIGIPGAAAATSEPDTNPMYETLKYTKENEVDKNIAPYEAHIKAMAEKYGVPDTLIKAVIARESRGIANAKNPDSTATGLMQIVIGTGKRLGVKDRLDPMQNIEGGAKYLGILLKKFDGDVEKAAAAYHEGEVALSENIAANGDKWRDNLSDAAKKYVPDVMSYTKMYGGASNSPSAPAESRRMTSQEISEQLLKNSDLDPGVIDKVAKMLGETSNSSSASSRIALEYEKEAGKNDRFNKANETRKALFEDKSDQNLYDDLTKAEIPTIGQALKDIDGILTPQGGIKGVNAKMEGTGYVQNILTPLLKSEAGVNMNALLKRIYSLELKRISGVAVSDAEFSRYREVFSTKGSNSASEQMFALRAFIRAYRSQLKLAKAAYGASWDRVAPKAGIDLESIPDVPDSTGKPPEDVSAPKADSAAVAKPSGKMTDAELVQKMLAEKKAK